MMIARIFGLLTLIVVALTAGLAGAETDGTKRPYTIRVQSLASDGSAVMPTPEPTATPAPTPAATPTPQDAPVYGYGVAGEVTHYGQSFNGQTMGCPPYDEYWGWNTSIAAVGPSRYQEWPCGTAFTITGPAGTIRVVRQDSCPSCSGTHIDLSEAGFESVCGPLSIGRCRVTIREE